MILAYLPFPIRHNRNKRNKQGEKKKQNEKTLKQSNTIPLSVGRSSIKPFKQFLVAFFSDGIAGSASSSSLTSTINGPLDFFCFLFIFAFTSNYQVTYIMFMSCGCLFVAFGFGVGTSLLFFEICCRFVGMFGDVVVVVVVIIITIIIIIGGLMHR